MILYLKKRFLYFLMPRPEAVHMSHLWQRLPVLGRTWRLSAKTRELPEALLLNLRQGSSCSALPQVIKGKVHEKKSKKILTSVSFAFTHTYTLEKLTLLLFSPKRTWKIFSWYLTRKLVSFYVRRQHQSIAVWWKGSKKSLKGQCAESFRQAHFCKSTGKRRALFWAKIRTKF